MEPVFVDFSSDPPRSGNAQIGMVKSFPAGDHLALDAGATVDIDFELDVHEAPGALGREVTLELRALVSKQGPRPGYAPMHVQVNEHHLMQAYRIPGGGDLPQHLRIAVPGDYLRPGTNTLSIRSSFDARTHLWLYEVLLEDVYDRGAAARALMAHTMREPMLTFSSLTLTDDGWLPGPPLRVYIDSGEGAPLSQLAWRSSDGSEGSVVLTRELNALHGHLRDSHGVWHELRGSQIKRQESPDGVADVTAMRFGTQSQWGGAWHPGGLLTVVLEGAGRLERLSWRDQRECSASIGLTADGTSFLGWAQRVGEGSIGYRGRALPR